MDKAVDAEQTRKEAGAVILRSYGNFLKHQDTNYKNLQKQSNNILSIQHSISKPFYPIGIDCTPFEHISLLDVIESDNIILNKILAVFSLLCEEIVSLEKEATERHYYFLAFYGEFNREKDITPEESIGNHIENLHLLTAFVKRCHEVVSNLCNQICGLFTSDLICIKGLRLNYVISRLGNILVILVTLDNLVSCSPLKNHWTAYCKAIRSLQQNPAKYNQTGDNLKAFHLVLNMIEDKIINDQIFQNCLSSLATLKKTLVEKNRMQVAQEFLNYIKTSLTELDRSTIDFYESKSAIQWVKVNALFVFYFHVFGNADKKVFKNLVDINLKAHSVPLFGLAVWHPEQFLLRHAGVLCSANNKLSQNMAKARHQYITGKKQSLSKDALSAQFLSSKWSLEVTQTFGMGETNLTASQMTYRMQLLFQGVKFASQINFIITSYISLHMSPGMPITKSSLMAICKLVEVLKGMNAVFQNNFSSIAASVNLIVQHLSYQIISQLITAKKHLIADKNYAKQRLDELTAIVIAERSLRGPATFQRRIVANVALSLVPTQIFDDDGLSKIFSLLETEENVINVLSKMNSLCDCSFMYWQKSIVPVYFQNVFDSKKDMSRLRLLFQALNDCSKAINFHDKYITNNENSESFDKEMEGCFYDTVLKPLSQQIETNLRLHIHSHLQLDSMNPFTVPVSDNTSLIMMNRFRFDNAYLSISDNVEHYLSYTFYNLTTVVLHNWKTYGEMRQLANFKFALKTVEDHLPTQTLEQGLDVLEIMRNIHIFVSKYLYNLNNQIFIEQGSNNKHLNTINIRHIANSIRTHGTGIMNTTVNFTYQFLKKKFNAFNQFMYDEQIKSRLIKDVRQFRKITSDTEKRYSYKRAEKFNKDIRTLGCSEDGHSYLDQFRLLISHIGNAMGYVRMVRSGGLHCCANATGFLPSLDCLSRPYPDDNNADQKTSGFSYIDLWQEDDPDIFVKESVNNLDMTINNLTSNFSQGTEYFQLLVDAFSPDLRNPDRLYLKTFHMIVPPLMLNFIEHMLLCKDKMNKKNISGAAFTDDGFAMGLAFILKLLDQYTEMDSLHWFKSVDAYIAQERASIKDQLSRGPVQLQQPLELTKKKLNVLEQEFQLLYFSFSSARIFFQ